MNRLEVSQSVGDNVDKIMADALLSTVDNTVKSKHENTAESSGSASAMSNNNKPPPTIFALQEICYPLTSALHTFFAQHDYTFITGLYGKKFNGYMGVGVAYPNEYFDTVNVDICRLSDERVDGWPRVEEEDVDTVGGKKRKQGLVQHFRKVINQLVRNKFVKQLTTPFSNNNNKNGDKEKTIDPWEMSENRFNVLVSVALRHRHNTNNSKESDDGTFLISNYHMPCAFYAPPVMNIHAEMVARRVQTLASNLYTTLHHQNDGTNKITDGGGIETIPYILAGDFNIMPNSSHYQLLTTGILDENDSTFPPPKYDMKWTVQSYAMDSAYAMMSSSSGGGGGNDNDNKEGGEGGGGEPEFTNYAHIQDQEDPFIGTLDYIFLSKKEKTTTTTDAATTARSSTIGKGKKDDDNDDNVVGQWWKVNGVSKLPTVLNSGGPFPNAVEPSDHLLIAADLELVSKK